LIRRPGAAHVSRRQAGRPVALRRALEAGEQPIGAAWNVTLEWRVHSCSRVSNVQRRFLMFLGLFVILLLMWMMGFFAFHVAGGLIHLLLIIAVISLVFHLIRGRSVA
jgi:hypothetical protein